ncbi:MAG: ACT domain-containing protein [Candidatus Methylomirabilaceae bacterium]
MTDMIRRVDYFYVETPNKPGEAARLLSTLKHAGINLLAFTGFPKGRRSQLDFIPADTAAFVSVAKRAKWKLSAKKSGFLIQGEDRPGALADLLGRLAAAKINVTAVDAVCAGADRWGAILWVKPRDLKRAAKALGAS